ncbi:MAG: bifunctional diaminohydroxyphosphoribosylaminopyrimidine deaminase/5-amino-6-(5-phosphoribosylamino)uracil reductase RibD [Actinobacteria bacterium]|nr:bifunctional diaminohydroxyphosphoribosylaminopyrimidine deaminase/5-amino-6-(5-phosphoribosylamino)uracil reductase RibD [Actinomycetota bacterium]
MSGSDEDFMERALELARSHPFTSPNPRVGAVLVRDGRILAEGAHETAGGLHAEVVALERADARGASLYVSLEPCSHQGRTPPCVTAILDAGVARVVAAMEDPDPRVGGDGFAALESAGIEVTRGVLESEARRLNAPYIHHRRTGRAFVSLKLALTLDGRMAAPDGSARWISGAETRAGVHRRRAEADAVMVGSGTVVADDPQLTARDVGAPCQPLRIVLDSSGRVAPDRKIFDDDARTLMVTTDAAPHDVQTAWKEAGAEVAVLPAAAGHVDLDELLDFLGERDILEVYCEGGAELATALLRDDLVDRLEIHYGPVLVGGGGRGIGDLGVIAMKDGLRYRTVDVDRTGDDAVVILMREEG